MIYVLPSKVVMYLFIFFYMHDLFEDCSSLHIGTKLWWRSINILFTNGDNLFCVQNVFLCVFEKVQVFFNDNNLVLERNFSLCC